ncbi:MAG: TonB-dependent receptor [Sinobacteraceae bacterium]|nr:TonB-dependent receptor [Nevskiaceae bacterium]
MAKMRIVFVAAGALMLPVAASYAQDSTNLDELLGPSPAQSAQQPAAPAQPAPAQAAPEQPAAAEPAAQQPTAGGTTAAGPATTPAAAEATPSATESTAAVKVPKSAPRGPISSSRVVEEIVVTAQKREESLQDIPLAVSAFSAGKLEAMGVQTIQDMPNVTPGLTITYAAGFVEAFLRGVGTNAFLPGADSSVPFYVDGIPLLAAQGASDNFGKIERVEVLKGPQGTLFGTNSVGGAINVITPDPKREFSGDIQVGYGNYNSKSALGYINAPITDNLAFSLSAFGNKQTNFFTNVSGPTWPIYSYGARLKVRWDITSNLSNTFTGSYQQVSDNAGLAFDQTRVAPVFAAIFQPNPYPLKERKLDLVGFDVGGQLHNNLLADTIDWKLPWVEVKLIGSAQRSKDDFVQATFGTGSLPYLLAQNRSPANQYTGELQLLSTPDTPFGDRFTWVGGLFYIYSAGGGNPFNFIAAPGLIPALGTVVLGQGGSQLGNALETLLDPVLSKLVGIDLSQGILIDNYGVIAGLSTSVYFQGTYKFTDWFNVTLGGRYQHTHKDLEGSRTQIDLSNGNSILLFHSTVPTLYANQFSPRVALQLLPFDDRTQIYASWARGYKTPTYNTVNLLGETFGPIKPVLQQKNDAYELGLKTELFDQSLRLNTAVFYTREKDLLEGFVSVLTGGVVSYDNVPSARIKGVEGDALWIPLPESDPGLVLTAAASYIDAKYTNYPNGRGFDEATGLAFGDGFPLPLLPARNLTGNWVTRTPNLTYNASVSQTLPLGSGSLEVAVDGNYNSGYYFLPQDSQLYRANAFYLLNAHATYTYDPWHLQLTAWAKNITNQTYNANELVDDFGILVQVNDPRTFGVRVKWSF